MLHLILHAVSRRYFCPHARSGTAPTSHWQQNRREDPPGRRIRRSAQRSRKPAAIDDADDEVRIYLAYSVRSICDDARAVLPPSEVGVREERVS